MQKKFSYQQYDAKTGLYCNRRCYYDPLQGRYITQDPIGLEGGWNPYMYPLNSTPHFKRKATTGQVHW